MNYYKTKVVSKHCISDWLQGVRNLLGMELKGYTKIIDKTISELMQEMESKGEIKYFNLSINEVQNGGIMITIWGQVKEADLK